MDIYTNICQKCGSRIEDFSHQIRIICPSCYETHRLLIIPALKTIQKDIVHKGKIPSSLVNRIEIDKEIYKLNTQLLQAIKKEYFELAVNLRDKIRVLEKALKKVSSQNEVENIT